MGILKILMGIILVVAIITSIVMWVISLISAGKRDNLKNSRILWIILIIFIAPLGSIIYFFVEGEKKNAIITLVAGLLPLIILPLYAIFAFASQ